MCGRAEEAYSLQQEVTPRSFNACS